MSNELCSLRPHEASLCFSAVFTLNEGLELLDEWFGRTVIHSDRRFTYAEAQEIIETGRGDYAEEVLTLNRLAQALRKAAFQKRRDQLRPRGGEIPTRRDGKPLGVYFKEQKESNQMIEEFMLLANRRVAEFCGKRKTDRGAPSERTMVYRVHDKPSEEKLDRFRQFILRFGHIFKATERACRGQGAEQALRPDQRVDRGERRLDDGRAFDGQSLLHDRQHRPLRPRIPLLYAFHVAHPPLS